MTDELLKELKPLVAAATTAATAVSAETAGTEQRLLTEAGRQRIPGGYAVLILISPAGAYPARINNAYKIISRLV